ncbi:MAG: hypothetical protein COC22_00170 [Flavobacteriaceae bacterium]|nr:MAG: hypothetical protein COC22_00170 [Flavobacteriaceae bacterium]
MSANHSPPELWGYQEVASYFHVSVKTIQNRVSEGILPTPLRIPGANTKRGAPMWLASTIAEYVEALISKQQEKPSRSKPRPGRRTKAEEIAARKQNESER